MSALQRHYLRQHRDGRPGPPHAVTAVTAGRVTCAPPTRGKATPLTHAQTNAAPGNTQTKLRVRRLTPPCAP